MADAKCKITSHLTSALDTIPRTIPVSMLLSQTKLERFSGIIGFSVLNVIVKVHNIRPVENGVKFNALDDILSTKNTEL